MHPLVVAELAADRKSGHDSSSSSSDGVAFRATTNHVHRTWAGTFSSLPELYIQPESLAEIEKVLDLARRCRRRITTVGCGHSPSNITCTSSWLLNLDNFNQILSIDRETGLATVQSGIRLWTLCDELDRLGLAMPNLGSINAQSIAGAISTGTHGSSLRHGLMSEDVVSLRITLASGKTEFCSADTNPDLFRAALLSLGALGIITEVTVRAVPAFSLKWQQVVDDDYKVFSTWDTDLWTQTEFVRVWWLPLTRRAVVWKADKTTEPETQPPVNYFDGPLGYYMYHTLLYIGQFVPRILPAVEWFVCGMQFGFANGTKVEAVQTSRNALLLNCLYSQYVNEWALPLHKGPEALRRLSTWLHHLTPDDPDYMPHNIPFSADGLYAHQPLEVRVSDTTLTSSVRPYLDPTVEDGPTLYLNSTFYRPHWRDPPGVARFYQAFEWLMKDLGGRPHWAKNFQTRRPEIEALYGDSIDAFRRQRDAVDPEGMFVGPWHRTRIMAEGPKLALEEVETSSRKMGGSTWTYGSV